LWDSGNRATAQSKKDRLMEFERPMRIERHADQTLIGRDHRSSHTFTNAIRFFSQEMSSK
jgi:hypothetical protein